MTKVTYDDLFALMDEMAIGAIDKSRTIEKVANSKVRNLILMESNMAISKGITAAILASSSSVIKLGMLGSVGGIGTGALSVGLTKLGYASFMATGGAAAAAGAGAGALKGGAAGSTLPIVGTIIGAAAGAGIGMLVVSRKNKKQLATKARLYQEVEIKQNTIIRDIEEELAELRKKSSDLLDQNERYKYIIGVLKANEELKVAMGISVI